MLRPSTHIPKEVKWEEFLESVDNCHWGVPTTRISGCRRQQRLHQNFLVFIGEGLVHRSSKPSKGLGPYSHITLRRSYKANPHHSGRILRHCGFCFRFSELLRHQELVLLPRHHWERCLEVLLLKPTICVDQSPWKRNVGEFPLANSGWETAFVQYFVWH